MRPTPPLVLLTFASIHQVMAAEHLLLGEGLPCDLVPTPRALSHSCGMSVTCEDAALPTLQALRDQGRLPWQGAFAEEGPAWRALGGVTGSPG